MTGHGLLDCGVGDGDCPSADSGRLVVGTCTYMSLVHVGLRQRHRSSLTGSARIIDKGVFTRVIVAAHCCARVGEGCVVGKSSASGTVYLVDVGQTTEEPSLSTDFGTTDMEYLKGQDFPINLRFSMG